MTHFYDEFCTENSTSLPEDESRHALKALRLRPGENFGVLNGNGLIINACMKASGDRILEYDVLSIEKKELPSVIIRLGISPLKHEDRFEILVEKATELGVSEIIPILCHRSEKKKVRNERMRRIIVAAAKQSGNPFFPLSTDIMSLEQFYGNDKSELKVIAHCLAGEKLSINNLPAANTISIAIGPEGDFTSDEVEMGLKYGFLPLSLGDLTLRAETAALSAISYFRLR